MTSNAELQLLLNRMIDEELSEEEESRLSEILNSGPEARRSYLRFMLLHADLQWSQGAFAAETAEPEIAPCPIIDRAPSRRTSRKMAFISAASALVLVAAGWRFLGSLMANPHWATVVSVTGAVSYRGDGGEQEVFGLATLPAGELLLKGDSAAVQLRLADRTLMTVNGEAEIVVDHQRPQEIHLRRGALTAEVQHQSPAQPLVFVTPTARVDVLGTVLSVSADSEKTRVHVDSGKVRVLRLVDGRSIDISEHESCIASLHANEPLRAIPDVRRNPGFVHDFTSPPPERWKGSWLPPFEGAPGRVAAVPCVMGQRLDGEMQPVIHYGITLRPASQIDLGALPEKARLILTYRVREPHRFLVMISACKPDGRFAGNFECKFESDRGSSIGAAFQRAEIPLSEFEPMDQRHPVLRPGDEPFLILLTSFGDDVGLEFSRVEIAGEPGSGQ
jgi:ferric-dicitrate binding protein FerR (iron transport regulator)